MIKPAKEPGLADRILENVLEEIRSRPNNYFPDSAPLGPPRIVFRTTDNNIARTIFGVRFEGDGQEVFVKVFDDPRRLPTQRLEVAAHENSSHLAALRIFAKHGSFGVAPLVGPFPRQPVVVVSKLPGTPLAYFLRRAVWKSRILGAGKQFCQTLVRVGGWLRAFHDGSASGATRPLRPEAVLSPILKVFDRLGSLKIEPKLRQRAVDYCQRCLAQSRVRELQCVDQHNDFLPHNILVTPERIVGLDFNSVTSAGSRLDDVANFLACLELPRKLPICSRKAVRQWQASFLRGYGGAEFDKFLIQVFTLRCILQLLDESLRYNQPTAPLTLYFVRRMLRRDLEEEMSFVGSH